MTRGRGAVLLTVLLGACEALPAWAPSETRTAAGPRSIVVDGRVEGCFHSSIHRLHLVPDGTGAYAASYRERVYSLPPGEGDRAATVTVREDDVAALRRDFDGLRWQWGAGCTTRVDYVLSVYEGDRLVSRETRTDRRCAGARGDDVTPIDLIRRAAPAHPIFTPRRRSGSVAGS